MNLPDIPINSHKVHEIILTDTVKLQVVETELFGVIFYALIDKEDEADEYIILVPNEPIQIGDAQITTDIWAQIRSKIGEEFFRTDRLL